MRNTDYKAENKSRREEMRLTCFHNNGKRLLRKALRNGMLLFLSFSLLFLFAFEKKSYASYINTNLNTFFHDPQNIPTGYP